MLEACQFNIPVLLVNSGLPMEQWVKDFVTENRIGYVEDDTGKLCSRVDDILGNLTQIEEYKNAAFDIAGRFAGQQEVRERLKKIILS
jgi:hypothetical protein